MKKSVMLMVGFMAVALAGSAQAATMFAVQNSGGTADMTAISDAGDITTAGKYFQGQQNVPLGAGPAITGPAGSFHLASQGNVGAAPAFLAQHAAYPLTLGGTDYGIGLAPNFSFYRINRNDASHPTAPLAYALPMATNKLGYFNFGTINTAVDPNLGTSRKNAAQFAVSAETNWTSVTDTPTFFTWSNTVVGGPLLEKMRLTSTGNLGIGTSAPTSKLHVVGLLTEPSPGVVPAGLTTGAFYKTATGVVMVAP